MTEKLQLHREIELENQRKLDQFLTCQKCLQACLEWAEAGCDPNTEPFICGNCPYEN